MPDRRIPIIRRDADGRIVDGTAAAERRPSGRWRVHDFRDLDGNELDLPPGAAFEITTGVGPDG